MASRKELKKQLKKATDLLIEDAFIESINGDEKEVAKMDKVVDKIIDDRYDLLSKVSTYPNKESRAKIKEHFKGIKDELEAKVATYTKEIGRVGA
jgi:hypothetical protein